jgi:beta-barrel assembly-enhancing protease
MKFKLFFLSAFGLLFLFISSCDKNGDLLIFSIENDKALGEQVALEIAKDPSFIILDPEDYSVSYGYLEGMMNDILSSQEISYKEEFDWKINIIDDETRNAFATPGGQIYVYTGLIFFLDNEDQLAGVIGHEIAHADQRHGSKQLQRQYGISILLSIISGGETTALQEIIGSIAGTGALLAFSREAEAEADDFSVEYLAGTDYACNGAAAFFQKILNIQPDKQPEFLSTHPSPDNRVADINAKADELGCDISVDSGSATRYQSFRNSLP